jgi:hypothetical protein
MSTSDKNKGFLTIEEYLESIRIGVLNDNDGFGYFVKMKHGKKQKTRVQAIPSFANRQGNIPRWATHVVWYEK